MSTEDPDSLTNKPPVPPREDLVKTAAKFLTQGRVQNSPANMKIAFLKKKGLSDAEIELAQSRCEIILQNRRAEQCGTGDGQYPLTYSNSPGLHQHQLWPQQTHMAWHRLRDIANMAMLVAGCLYAVYWLYKKYIRKLIMIDRQSGKKATEERLMEIELSLTEICKSLDGLKESVDSKGMVARDLNDLKLEVISLKKLLLSRKQFPATAGALSIPSWQIATVTGSEDKEEEGAATNGSDSSLEMIKE